MDFGVFLLYLFFSYAQRTLSFLWGNNIIFMSRDGPWKSCNWNRKLSRIINQLKIHFVRLQSSEISIKIDKLTAISTSTYVEFKIQIAIAVVKRTKSTFQWHWFYCSKVLNVQIHVFFADWCRHLYSLFCGSTEHVHAHTR